MEIKTALISVSDKQGIEELARFLEERDVEILSTGGTYKFLKEKGIKKILNVSEYTGSEEILNGRVKTLHPAIFAGILASRESNEHMLELKKKGILPIDLVVVNLYPFKEGLIRNLNHDEMIELIDVGGVSLIRAAAKNYVSCTVLTSPSDYRQFMDELSSTGKISITTRAEFAVKAFSLTSEYDSMIAGYLKETSGKIGEFELPEIFTMDLKKEMELRYGENPHQQGAIYRWKGDKLSLLDAEILHGKKMSYNNYMDVDTALNVVLEFNIPACCIVKHANPCGVGTGENVNEAFNRAYTTDPISAFGGIIAFNRPVDFITANDISSSFFEVIVAPDFHDDALSVLKKKKNLRLLKLPIGEFNPYPYHNLLRVRGGLLVQESDWAVEDPTKWEVVSDRQPTDMEMEAMIFAWKVVKWVKSNGIVLATREMTIGIGAGQPSRVGSVEIAIKNAHNQGKYTGGTALASDGFFPFRDSIDAAAEAGVSAVVEPGGSVRDREVIDAANEHDMVLVFTRTRHFRH
ncbi:bifunctional phosphoribosylaminoimidazolecarboxamide formyltransferase/inosine monophosphate cyclohydrolase [bacterium]|nr:MAG: bifunctional phosphoribosylaminoimidazolecarboxamide formyltransferase/inosine monophosphate cyclohydrolase [bacterium]